MVATDGGLVCMIERTALREAEPLMIVVCNSLTRVESPPSREGHHVFPDGAMTSDHLSMVQLRMDPNSQTYKLVFVRPSLRGAIAADVYQSASDAWRSCTESTTSKDLVFGHGCIWDLAEDDEDDGSYFVGTRGPPCVFDPAGGQLHQLVDDSYPITEYNRSVISHRLVVDRLFVLYALGSFCSDPLDARTEHVCGPHHI